MTTKSSIYGGREPWDLPAYTIPIAARYVRLPRATLRSWVIGRQYETSGEGLKRAQPLIFPPTGGGGFLSFTNLVEVHVLAARDELQRPLDGVTVHVSRELFKRVGPLFMGMPTARTYEVRLNMCDPAALKPA